MKFDFTALLGVLYGSEMTLAQSLRGVGLYESNNFKGISVSMAGGGYLNIAGKDGTFDGQAPNNQLSFTTTSVGDSSLTLNLPPMTEDDQFMSSPRSNRLVQTTPAISDLFNGTPMSSFENLDIDMFLTVTTSSTGRKLTCGNNCKVRYTWSYTPIIHYIVPSVVYPGMQIAVGINPKNAPNYKKSDQTPFQMRLDGTSLIFGDEYGVASQQQLRDSWGTTTNLGKNKLNWVKGFVDLEQRKNSTAEMTAFFRGAGYAMNDTEKLPTCFYDGVTCYNAKVMPTLQSVSHNSGYSTGGQNLTITGTSLESENIVVTVDDLPCDIQNKSDVAIICTTTQKTIVEGAPVPVNYIGQQGLTRHNFAVRGKHSDWRQLIENGSDKYKYKSIWTSLDLVLPSGQSSTTDAFTSYFKAPETAEYRFLMSCDDGCTFKISIDDPMDPDSRKQLMSSGSNTSYRNTDFTSKNEDNPLFKQRFSDWVSLAKDQLYFVETTLDQGTGAINLNVGMEIRPSVIPAGHSKLERQIQQVSLGYENMRYDTLEIIVVNPDDGIFKMAMNKPTNTTAFHKTGAIKANGTPAALLKEINGFYTSQYGVSPVVTKRWLDSDGVETTDGAENVYSSVYTIKVPTALKAPSVDLIILLPISTKSKFTVVYPIEKQLSTPPMKGKFFIECHSPDGKAYATQDMSIWNINAKNFQSRLETDCSFLKGKIVVTQIRDKYKKNAVGVEFRIFFRGIAADFNQYRLISSIEDPPEYYLTNPDAEEDTEEGEAGVDGEGQTDQTEDEGTEGDESGTGDSQDDNSDETNTDGSGSGDSQDDNSDETNTDGSGSGDSQGDSSGESNSGGDQAQGSGDTQDESQEPTNNDSSDSGSDSSDAQDSNSGQRRLLQSTAPVSIVKNQEIVRPFGTSLIWHTIPAEYFFTHETAPQIKVSIDGMPALCTGMACHYNYIVQESQVTAYALAGRKLTITGTTLVEPVKIEMGFIDCENIVVAESADSITCDLTDEIPVGSWLPQIHTENGIVKTEASVEETVVEMTITGVSPETDLNPAGGDILTITGTNFPPTIDSRYNFEINLDDKALCIPFEQTSTEIKCTTEPFKAKDGVGRRLVGIPFWLKLKLKQKDKPEVEIQKDGLTLDPEPIKVTGITPAKVSPIALIEIVIQLTDSYSTTGMTKDDFTVSLTPLVLEQTYLIINNDGNRDLNVVAVDTDAKTVTVKYGGAYLGTYNLIVKSETNGRIDTADIILTAAFELVDFSPKTGSIYGGTKLTITGGPFTSDPEETIVKVGYKWWEGINHYCYVIAVTTNVVTCRLPLDLKREAKGYDVILFSSTFYESKCKIEGDNACQFTFIDGGSLPKVTGPAVVKFNPLKGEYQLEIPTSGVTDNSSDIDFMLADKAQTVISASASKIIVEINDLQSGLQGNQIDLYLSAGYPEGYSLLSAVTFEPKLFSLDVNKGSQAGSIITAVVKGAGIKDKLTLYDEVNKRDICETSKMLEYGKLECHTKALVIDTAIDLSVQEVESKTVHACAASDADACKYQTFTSGSEQMEISTLDLQDSLLTITGTNFPEDAPTCIVTFLGIESTSCKRQSATSALAIFNLGIPTVSVDTKPTLSFTGQDATHFAIVPDSAVLKNELSITSVTSGLQSSFAGGAWLKVTANGFSRDVESKKTEVRVCSKPCKPIESVTSTEFSCAVPPIATIKSNSEFKIQSEKNLKGEKLIFGGIGETMAKRTIDDDILPSIGGSSANCFAGIQFATGYVGIVNEISFFLDEFEADIVIDHLLIQASSDNFVSSVETLATVSEEVHEGWNYYDLTEGGTKDPAKYRYYRLSSDVFKGCNSIGEIHYIGYEVIDDEQDTYTCDIDFVYFTTDAEGVVTETVEKQSQQVTYSVAATPVVTSISPRYGDVAGGTQITFTGKNFDVDSASLIDYLVFLDAVPCVVSSVTATEIVCTSGPRIGEWKQDPSILILLKGKESVAMQGNAYRYCALWSKESTWGNLYPPIDGESVTVPKGLCLLVDIQHSPKLRLVQVVGGALIFPSKDDDPTYHATFDARYIFITNGTMEIGTEEFPYKSKLTITMRGEKYDPAMPLFGKKSIGVSFGTLDIHGAPKKSWTDLDATVEVGATALTLVEEVDWEVGDEIMITSTDYNQYHTEFFKIKSLSKVGDKSTIDIDGAFKFRHYAAVETHGTDTLTMRAEVCLMSRNIIYRGDPETSARNKFGAHIMLHSPGDESVIGRIENLQLNDVGQAFLLGKYPIHFHMIGRVTQSYVRNNAIARSYNRGTTIHGVKYLRVERNCYWDIMGHTIFVEDAAETKNAILYNVVAGTKPSFSLLNTDTTPGSFWITHPDNIFVGNRAAGSTHYGFWMDYQLTAMGPSFDPKIKPMEAKLGEFRNNISHTCGKYGLRVFHGQFPKELTYYEDHLSYRCGRNGVMAGVDMGLVVFRNITVADNKRSGIAQENIKRLSPKQINIPGVEDLVAICLSNGNPGTCRNGVQGTSSDLWLVTNARFYNFKKGTGAINACTNCSNMIGVTGATTRFSKLMFDASVEQRVLWNENRFDGILHDLDGTLTEQGADSYVIPFWYKHLQWPECTVDIEVYQGIICPTPYAAERLGFGGAPGAVNVQRYPDEKLDGPVGSSQIYITNKNYYLKFGNGRDFNTITISITPFLWEQSDGSIHFTIPFNEVRAAVEFRPNVSGLQANTTLLTTISSDQIMGMNVVYNDTATREMEFVVNARDGSSSLQVKGRRCIVNCNIRPVEEEGEEKPTSLWSDPLSWPWLDNRIPVEGEAVIIKNNYNIIYDIGTSPIYKSLEVNGNLSFLRDQPAVLNTYALWVRAGKIDIGSADEPHEDEVQIQLHGNKTSESQFVFAEHIPVGNKNLIVTGTLNMYGKPRKSRFTRLTAPVYPGDKKLLVSTDLDLVNGDKLGLAATQLDLTVERESHFTETVTVESYDSQNGIVTLTEKLKGYHFGAFESTAEKFDGLDMRGEVLLLSSNVNVTSGPDLKYQCHILVADFFEPADFSYRAGSISFDNVAIYNCSQGGFPALRFATAMRGVKKVTNSAFFWGNGSAITSTFTQGLEIRNNVIHDFRGGGMSFTSKSTQLTIDNNVVSQVGGSGISVAVSISELQTMKPTDILLTNNIISDAGGAGIELPAYPCGESNINVNNVVHSTRGTGASIYDGAGITERSKCSEFGAFKGYKNKGSAVGFSSSTPKTVVRDIVSVHNGSGLGVSSNNRLEVYDCIIHGDRHLGFEHCQGKINCDDFCRGTSGISVPFFGGWAETSLHKNIKLIGFQKKNSCGKKQTAINAGGNPNYNIISDFSQIDFRDTDEQVLFRLASPNPGWANPTDCGDFTCTGRYQTLLRFESTKYSGSPMAFGMPTKFQITADNKESTSVQVVPRCEQKKQWNAYLCTNDDVGVLLFVSEDADKNDRASQPLYVIDAERGFNNRLNAFMDMAWDNAYTSQKRLQKFPSFVLIDRDYRIEYTGTPPSKQKFILLGTSMSKGTLITIPYPDKGAYKVYKDKELAIPTDWDYSTSNYAVPTGKYCGENRFNPVDNELEFWIQTGCELVIYPRDAVMLVVRLEWTVKEFFQEKGIGKFSDRMAAALKIAKADMKVVQVYEGSVIVEFEVMAPEGDPDSEKTLKALEKRFMEVAPTLGDSLGAPIMQIMTGDGQTVAMPGYEDLSNLAYNDKFKDLISEFLADREADYEERKEEQEEAAAERARQEKEKSEAEKSKSDDKDESTEDESETKERKVITIKQTEIVEVEEITIVQEETKRSTITLFLVIIVVIMIVLILVMLIFYLMNQKKREQKVSLRLQKKEQEMKSTEVHADEVGISIAENSAKQDQIEQYDPNKNGYQGFESVITSRHHAKVVSSTLSHYSRGPSDSLSLSDTSKAVLKASNPDNEKFTERSGSPVQDSVRQNILTGDVGGSRRRKKIVLDQDHADDTEVAERGSQQKSKRKQKRKVKSEETVGKGDGDVQ